MKTLYKKLSTVAIVLFLTGIVVVAYYLYNSSESVADALQIREVNQLTSIEQILRRSSIAVSIELVLGLLAILFLLFSRQSATQQSDTSIKGDTSNLATSDSVSHTEDTQVLNKKIAVIQSKVQEKGTNSKAKLEKVLATICNELEACQGAIFQAKQAESTRHLEMCASYAYFIAESKTVIYEFGEGLTGQVAKEGKLLNISSVPQGYVTIISGLGSSSPKNLIIVPIVSNVETVGVIEIASFKSFSKQDEQFLMELSQLLTELLSLQHKAETIA